MLYNLVMKPKQIILNALKEDIKTGDITTEIFIEKDMKFKGIIVAKEDGILCGTEFAKECFKVLNEKSEIKKLKNDGEWIKDGDVIIEIISDRTIFSAERTALNILQRLSGIATKTRMFVDLAKYYDVEIYDTRKTTPNLRVMEKYAVLCGGGKNHRSGLFDSFMIKDNHLEAIGGLEKLKEKIKIARKRHPTKEIEIEAQSIEQVLDFIKLDVDVIMIDNMDVGKAKRAIKIIRENRRDILIEISGGINEKNIKDYLKLKPDRISIGNLTHSYRSLDISMEIKPIKK